MILSLISCNNNKSPIETNFQEYLQDDWQINNELKIIKFEDDKYTVTRLINIIEDKGTLYPIIGNQIGWKSNYENSFGVMKYIKNINDGTDRESIIVTGLPNSVNKIDTIHRIFKLN